MDNTRRVLVFGILLSVVFSLTSYAEELVWEESQADLLPAGVQLFKGSRESPKLQVHFFKVDLKAQGIILQPYLFQQSNTVDILTKEVGAIAGINGGFFGGAESYSAVIANGKVLARNTATVTRDGKSHHVVRSLFHLNHKNQPGIDWIYHFGDSAAEAYAFDRSLPYRVKQLKPQGAPNKRNGKPLVNLQHAIGGGPRLLRKGKMHVTYNEEIFWGSGVEKESSAPRTAIGYTADNHVILFVADGRQPKLSIGLSLPELAKILQSLGCLEAMALDGGGSSQLATNKGFVNSPSEFRKVPSILALFRK